MRLRHEAFVCKAVCISGRVADVAGRDPAAALGAPAGYTQLITPDGQVQRQPGSAVALPVTAADREVANGRRGQFPSDPRVDGVPYGC